MHRSLLLTLVASALLIAAITFTHNTLGAAFVLNAAPLSLMHPHSLDDPLPEGAALVRAATERMGGRAWSSVKTFESIATAQSAMGDARIEYRFIAPDSHLLLQSSPTDQRVMEMGTTRGRAWMGEPGNARAVDPNMAQELAGGGDLQTLVRSLETRFEGFETLRRASVDSTVVWTVSMLPRGAPTAESRWLLYINAASGLVHGFDIPAPTKDAKSTAPTTTNQTIRLSRWEAVEHPAAFVGGDALLAFREAVVTASGMQTTLVYSKIEVNGLAADAIKVPTTLDAPVAAPTPTPRVSTNETIAAPTEIPDARALLTAATATLGDAARLAKLTSYRIHAEAVQLKQALDSQVWIRLPVDATVLYTRTDHAQWITRETIVGTDGEDKVVVHEAGRAGVVMWARDIDAPQDEGSPAQYSRLPVMSDLCERNDPFRLLYIDLPQHATKWLDPKTLAKELVENRPCYKVSARTPTARDDARVSTLWLDCESGEVVALRARESDTQTIFGAWQDAEWLRVPSTVSSKMLFAGVAVDATIDIALFNEVLDSDIEVPATLRDPIKVVPADKQRSTNDS